MKLFDNSEEDFESPIFGYSDIQADENVPEKKKKKKKKKVTLVINDPTPGPPGAQGPMGMMGERGIPGKPSDFRDYIKPFFAGCILSGVIGALITVVTSNLASTLLDFFR